MSGNVKLNQDQSRALLERAAQDHSQIVLQSDRWRQLTINGRLVSMDRDGLQMNVTGFPAVDPSKLVRTECEGHVYLEQRYRFVTTITDAISLGGRLTLRLARPGVLNKVDRRRHLRSKLAPSSHVTLCWRENDKDRVHEAQLLNISTDGIACRIEASVTASLQRKDSLNVQFKLPGASQTFKLAVAVTNKTLATSGNVILGLQFHPKPEDGKTMQALRRAIESHAGANVETEVYV